MGANLHTLALPSSEPEQIREIIVRWLAAKGFKPSSEASLFPFDEEDDRGLALASNGEWTTLAYSHAFQEGERLAFELKKICPVLLEIWVHDSDIWGYRLQEGGKLTASFNSNPRYFGGPPELELPLNGDPQRLCQAIGQPHRQPEVERLQRGRAVFAETTAQRFCRVLGAEPAGLDYATFDDLGLESGQAVDASGFQIEMLRFRRTSARAARPQSLHDVRIATRPTPTVDPHLAELQSQFERQMRPVHLFFRYVVGPVMHAIAWVAVPLFLLSLRFRRSHKPEWGVLYEELASDKRNVTEQQEHFLVNHRHGCRIVLPDDGKAVLVGPPDSVLQFQVGETHVHCDAIRPDRLRDALQAWPGCEIVEDENFSAGQLPARAVRFRLRQAQQNVHVAWYLVETPLAVYRFNARWEEEPSERQRADMRGVLESFELV